MSVLTITQLTGYIKEKLESDFNLNNVWVKGELSNYKHHSSGHMYFTLKDRNSALKCIMFRSRNASLNFLPAEGMAVVLRGNISVYERDGQYQLYVEEMQPDGRGALYMAFLALKARLEEEGLFDQGRKRPLPPFPGRVGVITSPTGAAVRDIITVITRRYPLTNILIIPVKVQGEEAAELIAEGIRTANLISDIDVLIVGRGGGSIEELWAFNTEVVARSIFNSRIPVISAVGHETDFTIADFVADLRAPTPSVAAELVVPELQDLHKHIHNLSFKLNALVRSKISQYGEKLRILNQSTALKRPMDHLYKKSLDLDFLMKGLNQSIERYMENRKNKMMGAVSKLDSLSPLGTLGRGYTICTDSAGNVVNRVEKVKAGDMVKIIASNGMLECTVDEVREGKYES